PSRTATRVTAPGPVPPTKSGTPSPVTSAVAVRTLTGCPGKKSRVPPRSYFPPDGLSARAVPSVGPPAAAGCGEKLTCRRYDRLPVSLVPLVAATVNANTPACVGRPVSSPVSARVTPGGGSPSVTVKVYGPGGPEAVSVWLYGRPTTASGRAAGLTATGT